MALSPDEIAAIAGKAAGFALQNMVGGLADMHAGYMEALRQADVKKRGRLKVRPAIITLFKALTSSTTTGTHDYRVPGEETFIVKDMRGLLAFTDFNGEAATLGNMNMSPRDWVLAKAANCKVGIKRLDTGVEIVLNGDLPLTSILLELGGAPIRFDQNSPGWVVPPGQLLRLTATLTDSGVSGQSSDYGAVLSGALLSIV